MDSWDSSHAEPSITTQSKKKKKLGSFFLFNIFFVRFCQGDFLLKAPSTTTHRSTLIIPDRRTPTKHLQHFDTINVVLHRDKRILDFGFSISDRLYGTGVYINKIRPNGPAELEGTLIPQMRIYQVENEENIFLLFRLSNFNKMFSGQ